MAAAKNMYFCKIVINSDQKLSVSVLAVLKDGKL